MASSLDQQCRPACLGDSWLTTKSRENGGNGWLRLITFVPKENQIEFRTYSPSLDQYETDADSQFTLPLVFAERFQPS